MEFREITTFLQVAQHQSFSKAARQLGYSQAAVTIQIKQLENELGVHLFDRIGKQISLTHQGQVFYQYAISIQKDLAQARQAVSDSSELNGKLCLGTIESICASIFPELLSEYHRLYPEVTISIVTDSPDVLLERMNENAIDIVYLLDRRIYDNRWHKTLEIPEENIFVASPGHELAQADRELELDEVLQFPFLLTEKDASYRHMLEQYLAASDRSIRPFLEIGSTEFIIHMLLKNTGISFLPEFTIRREVEQKRLTALKVRGFQMQTWRQIFYHKDKWVTREMQEFLRLAQKMQ
ncbi:LysR family transcriptional regulator [Clostridium sp. AM42-4]|jgi:DNA-binding transcriptional LysR family regulator|uniref:LysR family transcriptional regulator n=1 Tax=Clostridium sp. AM42-4 TaxID=2292305 RepID=UPI000E47E9C2|nr:LysR family transcriptional regulator [Clostridium sp. AM42-4]RHS87303.1 LysR family transcriptional regulator [Clostridium sp. AM42-4]HBM46361.1 LysR family transcriptional regulator [Lachnoclostridium sp.]